MRFGFRLLLLSPYRHCT